MTDSVAVLSLADRITDANGAPVSGAILSFFQAGTTTPLPVYGDPDLASAPLGSEVYCDSGGFPVTQENGSNRTLIYTGTAAYKVVVTDADSVPVWPTIDNIKGAIDTSLLSGGDSVAQSVPVVAKSASFTVVAPSDNGILFDCNCTGGDIVVTFPSAIAGGNGFYFGLRHNGTVNEVVAETVSSQTIRHFGAATDALPMTGRGETVWFVSDGANWVVDSYAPALLSSGQGILVVADRLSAPPVSPNAGAFYILTSSPSGAWSGFAEHDLVQSDGSASWIKRTPPTDCGWMCFVQDERRIYQFFNSQWVAMAREPAAQSDMESASSNQLPVTPGTFKYHPLSVKAWAVANISGSRLASSGISSVSDGGVSSIIFNFSEAFSSTNYSYQVYPEDSSKNMIARIDGVRGVSSIPFRAVDLSASFADPVNWHFVAFGDF